MNIDLFLIIYIIGAVISTCITFIYARPFEQLSHILKHNFTEGLIQLVFLIIVCLGYTMLSWVGALATYVIFKDTYKEL